VMQCKSPVSVVAVWHGESLHLTVALSSERNWMRASVGVSEWRADWAQFPRGAVRHQSGESVALAYKACMHAVRSVNRPRNVA
jgi:hypothetical protein